MPKIDETSPFIPVRIAVLDGVRHAHPRGRRSGRVLAELIGAAGHELAARAIVKDDVPR